MFCHVTPFSSHLRVRDCFLWDTNLTPASVHCVKLENNDTQWQFWEPFNRSCRQRRHPWFTPTFAAWHGRRPHGNAWNLPKDREQLEELAGRRTDPFHLLATRYRKYAYIVKTKVIIFYRLIIWTEVHCRAIIGMQCSLFQIYVLLTIYSPVKNGVGWVRVICMIISDLNCYHMIPNRQQGICRKRITTVQHLHTAYMGIWWHFIWPLSD